MVRIRIARRGCGIECKSASSGMQATTVKKIACVGLLAGVLGLLALAGCSQRCVTRQCDLNHPPLGLPLRVEKDPEVALIPDVASMADPATVMDPDRPPRFISLPEAFAMALENGTVGLQNLQNPGLVSEDLLGMGGFQVGGSDAVRVLAARPAITATQLESTLARFDPVWSTSMTWRKVDEPQVGLASFQNGAFGDFSTTLAKPLPTGGIAGVSFMTDYSLLANPPSGTFQVLNPTYTPRLVWGVEQPLLRGFGTDINQLLPGGPFSTLFPALNQRLGAGTPEGILVTRLRFDQQRAEFERAMNFLVLNVESAYWRLYGAFVDLYAAEQGLRQAHEAWILVKNRDEVGGTTAGQLALTRARFEQFRADRMTALGRVIDNERTLRILLGLPVDDGCRLVPADTPSLTPYQPTWQVALQDCLALRPELIMARKEVDARHKRLLVQQNNLLPDLRFRADYSSIGIGTSLDGPATEGPPGQETPRNALRSLTGNHFNNWTLGLTLNVPLGYRAENAGIRQARLELAQAYVTLKDQERRAQTTLARQYSRLIENSRLIEIRKKARVELATEVKERWRQYKEGRAGATLEFVLDAHREWATALSQEYQAVVDYNISLASFEFARGTILIYNKVTVTEGPLPFCADIRAVEHEREKTQAVVLRERDRSPILEHGPCETGLPPWPLASAPSVPALLSQSDALPMDIEKSRSAPALGLKDDASPRRSAVAPENPAAGAPSEGASTVEIEMMPARLALPVSEEAGPVRPALSTDPILGAPVGAGAALEATPDGSSNRK